MKRKNLILFLIGFVLIMVSVILMFSNSNKTIDVSEPKNQIMELENEINNLEITDIMEITKEYETKITELALVINELDSSIYDMYNNKEISLYDYMLYRNKIKKYKNDVEQLEVLLDNKIKSLT